MRGIHQLRLGLLATGAAVFVTPATAGAATATFESDAPITIPLGPAAVAPYPSTVSVDGLSTAVEDVDVTLRGYSHTCPVDVSALVVAPNGARSLLMADLGFGLGCPDSVNADLTFDDAAPAEVPYPPVTGTYRPTDPEPPPSGPTTFPAPAPQGDTHPLSLSAFNGAPLNGDWDLFVFDNSSTDGGSIAGGWSLRITSADETPDTDPPETEITKGAPNKTDKNKVKFKFTSSEPNSTFECKVDKKPYKPCTSPKKVKRLDDGKHKFKVIATDEAGNSDPSAAKDKFKVVE
jgi:hypothetical protein